MSANTSLGVYLPDFSSLALEERAVGLSPIVFNEVLSTPVDTLSPFIAAVVLYNPVDVVSPLINGIQTNIIERAESSEIRTNTLSWDIDQIVSVSGAGYKIQGKREKIYPSTPYYILDESESGGTFTGSSMFILPATAASGVHFHFIRVGGQLDVHPTGNNYLWRTALQAAESGSDVYVSLSTSGIFHVISNGNNRWYPIVEKNITMFP